MPILPKCIAVCPYWVRSHTVVHTGTYVSHDTSFTLTPSGSYLPHTNTHSPSHHTQRTQCQWVVEGRTWSGLFRVGQEALWLWGVFVGVGVCEIGSRQAVGFQPCVCEKLAEVRPGWQTSQVSVCVCVCVCERESSQGRGSNWAWSQRSAGCPSARRKTRGLFFSLSSISICFFFPVSLFFLIDQLEVVLLPNTLPHTHATNLHVLV